MMYFLCKICFRFLCEEFKNCFSCQYSATLDVGSNVEYLISLVGNQVC